MIRRSLNSDRETYRQALVDSHELLDQGKESSEIPALLSSKYQEREIRKLVNDIQEYDRLENYGILKGALRISLWTILILKIVNLVPVSFSLFSSSWWMLLLFAVSPALNLYTIYLAYRESPSAYLLIGLILSFSVLRLLDFEDIQYVIDFGLLNLLSLTILISYIAFAVALVTTAVLIRRIPYDVLKVKDELKDIKNSITHNN